MRIALAITTAVIATFISFSSAHAQSGARYTFCVVYGEPYITRPIPLAEAPPNISSLWYPYIEKMSQGQPFCTIDSGPSPEPAGMLMEEYQKALASYRDRFGSSLNVLDWPPKAAPRPKSKPTKWEVNLVPQGHCAAGSLTSWPNGAPRGCTLAPDVSGNQTLELFSTVGYGSRVVGCAAGTNVIFHPHGGVAMCQISTSGAGISAFKSRNGMISCGGGQTLIVELEGYASCN